MKRLVLSLLLVWAAASAAAQSAAQVRADFFARFSEAAARDAAQQMMQLNLAPDCLEALEFLYAYMAAPDMADYSVAFYAAQAECALRARREMPWGATVPEREWRHFVLPVRVNNERLDTFRTAMYDELKRRVAGLSMRDAVLEVNHWCHEHVTYWPSDPRTSSPLATMRTAKGRCGEESTFTVAALRTIGIPARQVYTPRWAHTDDNHAWVEAWVDGQWYFLGACEPEPVLNLGWFNAPASRGMLMHTRVYGRYDGPEDVMSRTPCFTEINVTANYAPVARATVLVVDSAGTPVPGADVEFRLYNYAEFYPVLRTQADATGRASITAGLGDLLVWAASGERYGLQLIRVGSGQEARVSLDHGPRDMFTLDINVTPPAGRPNTPRVPEAAVRANEHRKAQEDSLRATYEATFPDSAQTAAFATATGLDAARLWRLVGKSRGNYAALFTTVRRYGEHALDLLETLSDKDLRDMEPAVAADHLSATAADADTLGAWTATDAYRRYVLCPRIGYEHLSPWRHALRGAMSAEEQAAFRADPSQLALWLMQRVATDSVHNPLGLAVTPEGALRYGLADVAGQGRLFVAACRALGVPARWDEVTGKVQYAAAGAEPLEWVTVPFDDQRWRRLALAEERAAAARERLGLSADTLVTAAPADSLAPAAPQVVQPQLRLAYTPRQYMENPRYYTHFTLSRLRGGRPALLSYPDGDSWRASFAEPFETDPGTYLLTSGTRMAGGNVLARVSVFPVDAGMAVTAPLVMREDPTGLQVIGSFNSENRYLDAASGAVRSVLATTGRGYFVVGLLRAGSEPTNHMLHDLERMSTELEAWGRPIVLLFSTQAELDRFMRSRDEFRSLPSTVSFGVDSEGAVAADIFGSGLTASRELPVLLLADTFNRVVFCAQGYTIGVGDQIKQAVRKLQEQ